MPITQRTDSIGYVIVLPDPAVTKTYQTAYPNGINIPPLAALSLFNAPGTTGAYILLTGVGSSGVEQLNPGDTQIDPPGVYRGVPFHAAPTINGGTTPGPTVNGQPFSALSNAGLSTEQFTWSPWYDPTTDLPVVQITWFWNGVFIYQPPDGATIPAPPRIGIRRWSEGFELPQAMTGQTGAAAPQCSRDASRTSEGAGFAQRKNASASPINHVTNPTGGTRPNFSAERFYIRLRTLPVGGEDNLWACFGSIEGPSSAIINVTTSGALHAYNKGTSAYPGTSLFTTSALALNVWYRVDLQIQYNTIPSPGAPNGTLKMYLNGVLVGSGAGSSSDGGLATQQLHASSSVGTDSTAGASHGSELDIDDWCNADYLDPTIGSHITVVRPTGFSTINSGSFGGDWRELLTLPPYSLGGSNYPSSTTPSSILAVTTDYADLFGGCVAFTVGCFLSTAPTATCQIGYRINGIQTLVNFTGTTGGSPHVIYNTNAIANLSPVEFVFVKDPSATQTTVTSFLGTAEYQGIFGTVDLPTGSSVTVPPFDGIHNAPYRIGGGSSPLVVTAPGGAIQIMAGIYVGNDLAQDLTLMFGPHWWFARPLATTANGGTRWWSSMFGPHTASQQAMRANVLEQFIQTGVSGAAALHLATNDANTNQNAQVYQYVAVVDQAMRYLLNGAFAHDPSVASASVALVDTAFTPDASFLWSEDFTSSSNGAYYKGPGFGTNDAMAMPTGLQSNSYSTGPGTVTTLAAVNSKTPQGSFSLWRKSDGNTVNGQWWDCVTYTGNGGGARNIAVSLNGNSPLFAIVMPHNGIAWFRDPSHTGANSSTITLGSTTTGSITGGDINVVTVGATLNANGVVYDVFVLAGTPNAGNWSGNPPGGFYEPAPSLPRPSGAPYVNPPTPPTPLPEECISFAQAQLELANRLGDVGQIHWTGIELQTYLKEALRTYNAYTQVARDQGSFIASAGAPFYDLPTVLQSTTDSTFIRAYTLKDIDLIVDIEYALMEPPTTTVPLSWAGTAMFTLDQITEALQRRRDRFIRETGCRVDRAVTAVTVSGGGRIALPGDVITVRRAAWVTSAPVTIPLIRDSEWSLNNYRQTWTGGATPGATWPLAYSIAVEPPLKMQIAPVPNVNGNLDLCASRQGAAPDTTVGVLLGIPDDYVWVLKFGVLADLLAARGPANDPRRAKYCEDRWDQGIALATRASVVFDGAINGVITNINSLADADMYARNWQNVAGVPTRVLTTSQNLVALSPVPDNLASYTVVLDVVRNMPVPVLLTDCFYDGGNSVLEPIFSYAQYLALFKEGPDQFDAAQALLNDFLTAVGATSMIDQASSHDRGALFQETVQDTRVLNRQQPPEETTDVG